MCNLSKLASVLCWKSVGNVDYKKTEPTGWRGRAGLWALGVVHREDGGLARRC